MRWGHEEKTGVLRILNEAESSTPISCPQWNDQYQFGTRGAGSGVAVKQGIGVQEKYKGHPTITIIGDAAFGYSGMEMETLAKLRIPAIIVVYNNNAWGTWYLQDDETKVLPMHLVSGESQGYLRSSEGHYVPPWRPFCD